MVGDLLSSFEQQRFSVRGCSDFGELDHESAEITHVGTVRVVVLRTELEYVVERDR